MCLAVRRPRSSSAARAVSMKNQLGAGTLRRGRFLCWFAAARARYAGLLSCQEPPTPNWDRNVCIASLSAFSRPGCEIGLPAHRCRAHRHTSQPQSSGCPSARTVRRAHVSDMPSLTRRRIRSACSGVLTFPEKCPYLLTVSALLADAAFLGGFSLPLGMPLASSLPLDLPSPMAVL